jgi:hypothetical protein
LQPASVSASPSTGAHRAPVNRGAFLVAAGAAIFCNAVVRPGAFAATLRGTMTQDELFASLPPGRPGEWLRVTLGAGANYRKSIGLGSEASPAGRARLYVETRVGPPGGPWNPASMRKAYLRDAAFGSLVRPYAVVTNVGRSADAIYRYGEAAAASPASDANADTTLHLLDEPWIYDRRPLHVLSAEPERIRAAGAAYETIHVVARYGAPRASHERLERIDLWHAPDVPFGVVRYRAELRGLDPFELSMDAHGDGFTTMVPVSLDEVRSGRSFL